MDEPQLVSFRLTKLEWTEFIEVTGGGGFESAPTASPYLWIVFFKADGETLEVSNPSTPSLTGSATVVVTPGSHGDLGTRSVGVGDPISIPASLGQWSTLLLPIPVAPALQPFVGKEEPASIGFVAVLMNEDHVSDHGAEAGHQALNAGVQAAIDGLLATIGPDNMSISTQEIANATGQIPSTVHDAIVNAQSFWENLWSVSGPDKLIGFQVAMWSQPDLMPTQPITLKFGPDFNSWQLDGTVTMVDLCTATSVAIRAARRGASHCTGQTVVAGLPCGFSAQISAPVITPTRTFAFDWNVEGGDIASGQGQRSIVVNVHDGIMQLKTMVTVTDNLGCSITKSRTFAVVTPAIAAQFDWICQLRDEIRSLAIPVPGPLLHPAGPDPGPDPTLMKLHDLAQRLVDATRAVTER